MPKDAQGRYKQRINGTTRTPGEALASQLAFLLQNGMERHRAGDLAAAESFYRRVLQVQPAQPDALHLLGLIAHQVGRYSVALEFFDQAIRINPRYEVYFSNRGNTLKALKQFDAALESFDHALRLKPEYADAYFNRGVVQQEMGRLAEALESYDRALALQPHLAQAHNNRGNVLRGLRRYEEALASFEKAARLEPHSPDPYNNCGNVLLDMKAFKAAIERYNQALEFNPRLTQAHSNRGVAHLELKNYREALASFDTALAIEPSFKYLPGMRVHMKRMLCAWDNADKERAELERMVSEGRTAASPFCMLSLTDDPALQKKAAEIYIGDTCAAGMSSAGISGHARQEKIRIGYFSSDFHDHPVSYLLAEVLERHDRTRFEIIAFSTGPERRDSMRIRVRKAVDRFIDVHPMSDSEIAQAARTAGIDIAVDLNGLTYGDRTKIFAERVAPVQVNYLGYPGTMGAPFIDYIFADPVLIPDGSRQFYSEKVAYLPDCFQANDSTRTIYHQSTRAAQGLPESGFVYCCFNSSYKIAPEVFTLWMKILDRVEGSVLWLQGGTVEARENLRNEAKMRGIAPVRLIFAEPVPLDEHLGRMQLGDLFLDTLPFNAGASASPALWAGLPVLTRQGRSFAGRMGASLLHAIGMPDLITSTEEEYVDLAVQIGTDGSLAQALKERLRANRNTAPLFDTARFTKNLEAAYSAMYERCQSGLLPDHIQVCDGAER